ncbi:MAG: hypothetical protein V1790_16150 [Planctomycetota bacterium]
MPVPPTPLAIDLKELLRRALDSKIRRALLVVKRAASIALTEPGADLSDFDRALLESIIEGDHVDGWQVGGGRGLKFVLPDKHLDLLVSGWSRVEAEKAIRSEEAIRLGTHSGRPTAWELTFDLVLAAITNRTVGYSNPKIVADLLEELCWKLVLGKAVDWKDGEEHLAALQREGFARELLEELWKQCLGEAAEMKLPRLDATTSRQGAGAPATPAGLGDVVEDEKGAIAPANTARPGLNAAVLGSSSKSPRTAITLEQILVRVHGRAKELCERIDRRACRLRAETDRGEELSEAQRATLLEVADGKQSLDVARNDERLKSAFGEWVRGKANKEVLREYADGLGQPSHRKTAWEVVTNAFFAAAERVVDGFKVTDAYRDWWEGQFWSYCESLSTGKVTLSTDRADLFRRAGEALETPSFVHDVLDRLERECPQEARDLALLGPSDGLPDGGRMAGIPIESEPPGGDRALLKLSPPAWVILKRLVKSPTPLHRKDLAGKADPDDPAFLLPSDEETIGDYLTELIEKRFATRLAPRKGATATEAGRRYMIGHTEDTAL